MLRQPTVRCLVISASLFVLVLSGCGLDPELDIDTVFDDADAPYPKSLPLNLPDASAEPRLDENSSAAHEARAARLRPKAQEPLATPVDR